MSKYQLKNGKFGSYFYNCITEKELSLNEVLDKLNSDQKLIPENNRQILVKKRREGKTETLIKMAVKKLRENKNVLFIVPSNSLIKTIYAPIFLQKFNCYHNVNNNRFYIDKEGKYNCKLMSYEFFKSISCDQSLYANCYKILDEVGLDVYNFDLISINGQLAE